MAPSPCDLRERIASCPTTAPSVGEKCAQWRTALALLTAILVSHLKAKLGWCQLAAGVDFQFAKRLRVSDISMSHYSFSLALWPIFISAIMCECQVHSYTVESLAAGISFPSILPSAPVKKQDVGRRYCAYCRPFQVGAVWDGRPRGTPKRGINTARLPGMTPIWHQHKSWMDIRINTQCTS